MKALRQVRSVALQALYEIDCTDHPAHEVITLRLEAEDEDGHPLSAGGEVRVHELVSGVMTHRKALDALISHHAPEWPLKQMAIIDRNVLRIAIYEFAVSQQTPVKVAINEAVELAKLYGSDSAPRFVNGVLGALAAKKAELVASFNTSDDGQG